MQQRRIHHQGNILGNRFIAQNLTGTCHYLAPDAVAADIAAPGLQIDLMICLVNFVLIEWLCVTAPFPIQMSIIQPQLKLIGFFSRIQQLQVQIIIGAGCSAAERLGPLLIRKHIITMPVPFRYTQRSVQCHPIDQIGQLA
ncbi:hypothetical protein D3C74_331450 [compost metagenome]